MGQRAEETGGVLQRPGIEVVFDALGDASRREMVVRLASTGRMLTADLTSGLGMTRQGARRHLEVLEKAGLVSSERSGREVYRRLNPARLQEMQAWLDALGEQWDTALGRLAEGYGKRRDAES